MLVEVLHTRQLLTPFAVGEDKLSKAGPEANRIAGGGR